MYLSVFVSEQQNKISARSSAAAASPSLQTPVHCIPALCRVQCRKVLLRVLKALKTTQKQEVEFGPKNNHTASRTQNKTPSPWRGEQKSRTIRGRRKSARSIAERVLIP